MKARSDIVTPRNTMKQLLGEALIFLMALAAAVRAQDGLPYTTYTSFSQGLEGASAHYAVVTRVSDPGSSGHRAYTGFFFYQCLQFDTTGRYLLAMRVYFQTRDVK